VSVFAKCGHSVQNMAAVCGRCIPANADELLASLRATIEEQRQRIEELEATIERMHTGSAVSAAKWSEAVTVAVDRAEQAESERDALREALSVYGVHMLTDGPKRDAGAPCATHGTWDEEGNEGPPGPCDCGLDAALARNPEGPPRRSTRDGEE
jgi:chorismate mutase